VTIRFDRSSYISRWLTGAPEPEEKHVEVEWRTDPLTGDVSMLLDIPVRLPEPDFNTLVARSLERPCPFCPENITRAASRFPAGFIPEGQLAAGKAILFPNIVPWVPHSAVAVLNPAHFLRPVEFNENDILNGMLVCQEYLKRLARYAPEAEHCFLGWNYLPPASSSQLHAHLQVFASEQPLRRQRELLQASQAYYNAGGTRFWTDYVNEEKSLGKRYVATLGSTEWFTSFVSRSWLLDLTVVFPGQVTLAELPTPSLRDFCHGLVKVFRYMAEKNYFSFNMAIYSGLSGESDFTTHARIIQRVAAPPVDQCDAGVFQMLQDSYITLRSPEVVCQELKEAFSPSFEARG
jgi:galactose-1-phosphate uridylyltransferase